MNDQNMQDNNLEMNKERMGKGAPGNPAMGNPEMAQKMKKVGSQMSLLMGVTLSFCLSLTGNLMGAKQSGGFSVPGFLISFVVSTIISLIIGFFVPMKKVNDSVCGSLNLKPGQMGTRLMESLISDIIYTPVMTLIMVFLAYKQATSHGAQIPFLPMFLSSLVVCLIVGYILIFIFMPLYMKLVMKKNGLNMPD